MEPKIIDVDGNEQPFSYAVEKYGAIYTGVESYQGRAFRLVELREQEGPAIQMTHVQSRDGAPMHKVEICRWWPGAPDDFPEGELGENHKPVSQWYERAVHGPTNPEGDQGFGVGPGDVIGDEITNAIWIASWDAPSDLYESQGVWLGGTNHRHLACIFEYRVDEGNGPPGPPEDVDSVMDALRVAKMAIDEAIRLLVG
jgi:hypothetical protein